MLPAAVLARVLQEVAAEDIQLRRNVIDHRRFIAVCVSPQPHLSSSQLTVFVCKILYFFFNAIYLC